MQLDLDTTGIIFSMLTLRQVESLKEVQHTSVLAHYQRVKEPNSFITRFIYQLMRQVQAQPTPLPAVLDESGVLGPVTTRFAVVAYDSGDLVRFVRIQGNQLEVIDVIDMSEILGLLIGELLHGTEEAQVDRLIAKASVEPL